MSEEVTLNRSISFFGLLFFGVGTMVGGGFYALLGKVAAEAGILTPLAMLLAGVIALINGLTFAELSSRFPVSAGEVKFVSEGFNSRLLSVVTGWLVILTGVVSSATLSLATAGFLADLVGLPIVLGVVATVLLLGIVAAWGVRESVTTVVVITTIEVGALLLIAVLNIDHLGGLSSKFQVSSVSLSAVSAIAVFNAAFLCVYSFIGFEDMVNMAEEVVEPKKTLPKAIPLCVLITTILYVLVSAIAVAAADINQLAASRTPMAVLVDASGSFGPVAIGVVSILTGINGALVQIVMVSRVSYGMAKRNQAPCWLATVHPVTRTPLYATALMSGVVLMLALFFPLIALAKVTASIILVVFALVNASLWRIKSRAPALGEPEYLCPDWNPPLGAVLCVALLLTQLL